MHQRHNNPAELQCRAASATGVASNDNVMNVSSSVRDRSVPRRRRRTSTARRFSSVSSIVSAVFSSVRWPNFSGRKRLPNARKAKRITWKEILDLDTLATLLQLTSALIMVGCMITLMIHAGNSNYDDEVQSKSTGSWWSLFGWMDSGNGHNGNRPNRNRGRNRYGTGLNAHYPRVPLPPNPLYQIPDSMAHLGDRSDRYALLRKEIDAIEDELPIPELTYQFSPITTDNGIPVPYDIYNCPEEPPSDYPYAWNLIDVLKAWPADDTAHRAEIHQGLCVFDYVNDLEKAYRYRDAELPFVIRNDPQVVRAVKRWNSPKYMERMIGNVNHRAEYSESNHFMYWNPPRKVPKFGGKKANTIKEDKGKDWKQPTEMIRMTYRDWLEKANTTDDSQLGPDMPHWYFRLIGCGETGPEGQCDNTAASEYLFDELTFFQPKESLYMVDPREQKGIHCRFGMKGVIAENHFDGSRNMIVVLGGERRYILSHPDQCPLLNLLPKGHPSARHSEMDWSKPDMDAYPEFAIAKGNEVVLQAGDVLYLPTNWFHFIVSLSVNFQCNTRSGIGNEYMPPIHHCGF